MADLLVAANLAGHDSHVVLNIPQYVAKVESGEIVPGAPLQTEEETAATAGVNGNWGFGHADCRRGDADGGAEGPGGFGGNCDGSSLQSRGPAGGVPPIAAAEGMVGLVCLNGHGGAPSRLWPTIRF